MRPRLLYLLIAMSLVSIPVWAQTPEGKEAHQSTERYRFPPPVLMRVLDPPRVARVNGAGALVYELLLTNLSEAAIPLDKLECLQGENVVQAFEAQELKGMLGRPSFAGGPLELAELPPRETVLLYVWIDLPDGTAPELLSHRLFVQGNAVVGAVTEVDHRPPLQVGLPFRKPGVWAAVGAPSNTAGHRRAAIAVDGRLWISQRFAIDWIMLGADGKMATGDGSRNEDHYCYGAEAIAVADGRVAGVFNQVPENVPSPDKRAVDINLITVGGNWVALEIGEGQYAMYAHLIPGSLRVKRGDKVKKGDVLGLVGNSGNSTAPHLHFHLSATPDWIPSVGLPYVIDAFEELGVIEEKEGSDDFQLVPQPGGPAPRTGDLPAESEAIRVTP